MQCRIEHFASLVSLAWVASCSGAEPPRAPAGPTLSPTSFGPVSYSIERQGARVRVTVDPPPSAPTTLRIRLRLPGRERIASVWLAGHRVPYDRAGTIDLSRRSGPLQLEVTVAKVPG